MEIQINKLRKIMREKAATKWNTTTDSDVTTGTNAPTNPPTVSDYDYDYDVISTGINTLPSNDVTTILDFMSTRYTMTETMELASSRRPIKFNCTGKHNDIYKSERVWFLNNSENVKKILQSAATFFH